MVPVGDAGNDDPLKILEDVRHWLRVIRRVSGELGFDSARCDPREDRIPLAVCEVVGDPIDHPVAMASKAVRVHVVHKGRCRIILLFSGHSVSASQRSWRTTTYPRAPPLPM